MMIEFMRIRELIVLLVATLAPACVSAQEQEMRPHALLVLDQAESRGPFYDLIYSGLRNVVDAHDSTVTLYAENLDLNRFNGPAYEQNLKRYLHEKYEGKPIGAVVAIGAGALECALHWREELWPGIPIVFTMVDELDFERLKPPPDVTGMIAKTPLADSIKVARAVVPNLDTVFIVGDPWKKVVVFRSWADEIPTAAAGLKVIEIIGEKMSDIRKRVAELPERSAIIYASIYSDGEGSYLLPLTAVGLIAEKANRPIVVAAETFLGPGGIGGYVLVPSTIGADAAKIALRVLDGERTENIPRESGGVKPIFNWPQLERWNVSEAQLPPGSEIRFREPSLWEKYRWQSLTALAILLAQAGLIAILLYERKKRHRAEVESRHRMSELAHVNRSATAGELSSSIAHELNQPLGAILTNAETAELILSGQSPDLNEVKEILADIRRDDLRANEVIRRLRSFMKRTTFETKDIDLNELLREVFDFLSVQAGSRNVTLYLTASPKALRVMGDPVQLQQVMINLIVNSMDAMAAIPSGKAVIGRAEMNGGRSAVISISDSGPGIPAEQLPHVFDPFFTTKEQGMGIGLSIARTIVLAHEGKIWAENDAGGGAVFRVSLPLSAA
jgi:signal transduction histidine kinase